MRNHAGHEVDVGVAVGLPDEIGTRRRITGLSAGGNGADGSDPERQKKTEGWRARVSGERHTSGPRSYVNRPGHEKSQTRSPRTANTTPPDFRMELPLLRWSEDQADLRLDGPNRPACVQKRQPATFFVKSSRRSGGCLSDPQEDPERGFPK